MSMFKKEFKGYKCSEVDAEIKKRNEQAKEQSETLEKLQREVEHLREQNGILSHRVTITEKTNEEIARLALKEASDLIDKAKRNADMILKESLDYVRGLSGEMDDFKDRAVQFRASVQKMSKDIVDTIDSSEVFHLMKDEQE